MSDRHTVEVYDARAGDYEKANARLYELDDLEAFAARLPTGGRVLDLGCGPGFYAAKLAEWGFEADATDASAEMVARAARKPGVTAWQARFDELDAVGIYDGIWANFSLLHLPRVEMPEMLRRIRRAGKPGMALHVGLKLGEGEGPDGIGRFYAYYGEDELLGLLRDAGFEVIARRFGRGKGLDGSLSEHIVVLAHG
ncbi:MAG: Methyltransferase domain [Rhodobacteraceae bacterium HLUCCO07]|nr:MAG: Methyltransferase domain [Rhodobacteraceae bacterium HLUCCO07]